MKMFNKNKLALLLSALLVVPTVISACGKPDKDNKSSNEKVTLEFWTISLRPKFDKYFENAFEEYKKSHPNVEIKWQDLPYDAIESKLLSSISSGNGPDVVNLNSEFALKMAEKNALVDFNKELKSEEKAVYQEGLYNSAKYKDGVYALPWYTGADVLFINKSIAEKAGLDINKVPKTYDEMMEWSKVIKEKTGKYGMNAIGVNHFVIEGIPFVTEDGKKAAFNTPEAKDYVKKYVDGIQQGYIPKAKGTYDEATKSFATGNLAMFVVSPQFVNRLKTEGPDVYKNTIVTTPPIGKAGVTLSPLMNITVPTKTKNKKEAVEFAKFITNDANQIQFAKEAGTLPSTKDSMNSDYFKQTSGSLEDETKMKSIKALETAIDFPFYKYPPEMIEMLNKSFENIFFGGADLNKEFESAEKRADDILAKQK